MCILVPAALLGWIFVSQRHDPAARVGSEGGAEIAPDPARTTVGAPAPDFALPALDGTTVTLAQYRGRPVVLTFFASWCHPCEEELPVLEDLQQDQGDRLQVLAVNYRDFVADTRRFVERLGVTYPVLLENSTDNPVAALYGVRGVPVTFFIDANGAIAHPALFGESSRRALQPGIDALLP